MYDVVIIGGGVAGLTAGLYLSRANKKCVILEGRFLGGQTALLNTVANYPALPNISGFDLVNNLVEQVKSFNTEIKNEIVIDVKKNKNFNIVTNKSKYIAKNLIIASGAKTSSLGLKNEKQFIGKGLSYCATCDGNFFKNQPVAVVGIGKTALEDIKYLDNIVSKLYWIIPNNSLNNKILEEVKSLKKLKIIYSSEVLELVGENTIQKILINDKINKNTYYLEIKGLFVSLGRKPDLTWLNIDVKKNKEGYIIVDKNCKTNVDNLYACGDITYKDLKQIVTACSDGAVAASEIIKQ